MEPWGSWGNPKPTVLPRFSTATRKPISPPVAIALEPLFLPAESPVDTHDNWSDPAPVPIDPVLLALPPDPVQRGPDTAGPSMKAFDPSPPPLFFGSSMHVTSTDYTTDPPRGSWGNPEPVDFPLQSHVSQPGSWGNPVPVQLPRMPNVKRGPSPTSPERDDTLAGSRSRKGKARKLDTPEEQPKGLMYESKEFEAETKTLPRKLGPRWVTSESSEPSPSVSTATHHPPATVSAPTDSLAPPAIAKTSPAKDASNAAVPISREPRRGILKESFITATETPSDIPENALALSDIGGTAKQNASTTVDEGLAAPTQPHTPTPVVNLESVNPEQPMDVDPDTSVDISPLIPTHREYDTGNVFSPTPEVLQADPVVDITSVEQSDTEPFINLSPPLAVSEPLTAAIAASQASPNTLATPYIDIAPSAASEPAVQTPLEATPHFGVKPKGSDLKFVPSSDAIAVPGTAQQADSSAAVSPAHVTQSPDGPPAGMASTPGDTSTFITAAATVTDHVSTDSIVLDTASTELATAEEPSGLGSKSLIQQLPDSLPPAIFAPETSSAVSPSSGSALGIESSETSTPITGAPLVQEEADIKPSLPDMSTVVNTLGRTSMDPIELDDEDLDFLTSDNEEYDVVNGGAESAVENVSADVEPSESQPAIAEVEDTAAEREFRHGSIGKTPSIQEASSIQEIKPEEARQMVEANPSRRSTRISERSPGEEPAHDGGSSRSQALDTIRSRRRIKRDTPSGISLTPVVEIPTRSRRTWEGVVESEGESDVEAMLDLYSESPDSTGPFRALHSMEYQGFTLRSTFDIPLDSNGNIQYQDFDDVMVSPVHSILSISIPDTPAPPERAGQANRILNTRLIDEWNRRKPTLTNNPPLHRAVFEAYMAQSTSIDEPQADEIRVVNDVDAEGAPPDFEFQYSNDMLYNPDVPDPELGRGCDCEGPCDPTAGTCSCVKRQELYFYDLGMTGFAYNEHGHIKETSVAVWECGKNCGCPPSCMNRVIQRGRGKDTKIELFKTKWKGWGVRARANIPAGTFLGIYAGELITEQESEERGKLYAKLGRTYLFDCDGWQIANPPAGLAKFDPRAAELAKLASQRAIMAVAEANDPSYVYSAYSVDAFHYGFTRYFNHSCDPNLAITQAYVRDFHPERPILVIFTRRPVKMNEELCISYKGLPDDEAIPEPARTRKPLGTGGKNKKNKTSASAHITYVTKSKVAAKDRCMCKTARCDGRMFNYGG
ncbi:hypothetical protein I316_02164 [Kwoniella heveanensis BCC8398]|uniref:Histone-lysine N-methyltransferase SUV39H n=1 Tax=Kwoniella heveanensis BCC8398 TaxID=1296120 RepID=A0A1B9GZ48_9TREE|nr:hypothetical protein I316_02164 [Kwoniella heveanensis BCC8398]